MRLIWLSVIFACASVLSQGLGHAESNTHMRVRAAATLVLCNTREQQAQLWHARQKSRAEYEATYRAQGMYGCVEISEIDAITVSRIGVYPFEEGGYPVAAIVYMIRTRQGSTAYLARVVPWGG